MELVGAHQVLGLLGDLALDGGEKLRGDGGVQDVGEDAGELGVLLLLVVADEAHQMADQGLGDAGVDGVVAHVVAVVGTPAQGQLGEVAGADDQANRLVGDVHEDLGPLPGLAVFKGDVVVGHGLADVLEVDLHRPADVDGLEGAAQPLGQQYRVGLGAVGGAEAGHGDGDDVGGGAAEHLHGHRRDEDGQGGVQAAGEAHHRRLGVGVLQPLLEPQGGHVQDLVAPLRPVGLVLGDEGGGGDGPGQVGVAQVQVKADPPQALLLRQGLEGIQPLPLGAQAVHVDLADGEAGGKALLGEEDAVFGDHVVASEDQVGGGLPLPGVGVDVAAQQPARLPRHQGAAVGGLAHRLVGGGEVEDEGGARPGRPDGGGLRRPQVLADLHADDQPGQLGAVEEVAVRQADLLAAQGEGDLRSGAGGEPAPLVELAVVGQMGLGHQAQDLALVEDGGAVVELAVPGVPDGQADGGDHVQVLGGLQDGPEPFLSTPEQGGLEEKVPAGVAGEAQLGEGEDLHPLLGGLPHEGEDLFGVITAVGHPDGRGAGGDFHKTIAHVHDLLFALISFYPKEKPFARKEGGKKVYRFFTGSFHPCP